MLDRLTPRPGARRSRRRVGRGPGSGTGKTTGTGVKGQGTRSGKKIKAWFEGGQMPITQRVPKRGFTNKFRKDVEVVNVGELARLGDGATVNAETLTQSGLIRGTAKLVKLLGEGDSPQNLTVKLSRISASARTKVESAGGTVELV
ncbi:MAG: 50S ribosomal protein L15 [Myxococcota bacterium]|nr:50S ribosomal protein L15 [Myxococcota bacterium]